MKIVEIGLALGAGLVGAAGGHVLLSSSSSSGPAEGRLAELERRYEEQTDKVRQLQRTLDDLHGEFALWEGLPRTVAVPTRSLETLQPSEDEPAREASPKSSSGARMPIPERTAGSAPTPEFRDWVKTVLEEQKAEEEALLRKAAEERRIERIDRRVDRAVQELKLSNYHSTEMRRILLEEETARAELFAKMRDPESDRQDLGQSFRAIRDQRETRMIQLLGTDLYDQFQSLDRGRGGFVGGFGGGPRSQGAQGTSKGTSGN